ncbi:MmgE/PrpD family protein [Pseudohoeflea coraliihabitans]|uniref:MmgE/PrpD family protein n=1 Tax=Pseudohoeflea coraliihabitans TaxID=2860393 RepID=A0ABS6WSM0_9HYPH|nr:MmgE/PrpD family protein [Pseudohoeflea sp. DP4N28-3]MBW3098959.1 MmgE/PrpD family protein [Pseudohoeflea sp. DP4N28-3]
MAFIDELIELAAQPDDRLPPKAMMLARYSLLDWLTCGVAAIDEPLVTKLRQLAEEEGGKPVAPLFGGGMAPARMAALVNGAASHALDYDDTHFAHVGHLSVGIYPAAMAAGVEQDLGADAILKAFVVGAEAAIRIGLVLGREHYLMGFHQTATAGAFGATIAAARLYKLDDRQLRNALGLCATRASGLKSQFGTMGKPYNAGIAASNGIECARLAALGMTSADDGLLGVQGFVETHTPQGRGMAGADTAGRPQGGAFLFEDNKYKLHACCHGLHAMIEAVLDAEALCGRAIKDVAAMTLRTNPRWLRVCDIKRPRTGLEVKFSYNWLFGMTVRGDKTGDDRAYTDALAADQELAALAECIEVIGDESLSDLQAEGVVTLSDGTTVPISHDLAAPLPEDVLAERLQAKAVAILGDRGNRIWNQLGGLDALAARDIGALMAPRA